MTYLLDTNVISETIKKNPNKGVLDWLISIDLSQLYLSVLTLGEIRKGIEKLNDQARKQAIIMWLETELMVRFCGRLIPIDHQVADKWGYLSAIRSFSAIDALIAASAMVHNHKLVTPNTKDFLGMDGLEIVNPWELFGDK